MKRLEIKGVDILPLLLGQGDLERVVQTVQRTPGAPQNLSPVEEDVYWGGPR